MRLFPDSSALYATTGIPAASALFTGVLKAVGSISVVAMPLTLPAIATLIAFTISETTEFAEPVHCGFGIPRIFAASAIPYWVGVKNVLVVTWFTNVNL